MRIIIKNLTIYFFNSGPVKNCQLGFYFGGSVSKRRTCPTGYTNKIVEILCALKATNDFKIYIPDTERHRCYCLRYYQECRCMSERYVERKNNIVEVYSNNKSIIIEDVQSFIFTLESFCSKSE